MPDVIPKKPRPRRFRHASVLFDAECEIFDGGNRKAAFEVVPGKGVRMSLARTSGARFLSFAAIWLHATAAVADFNPAPRSGRITRGGKS